MTLPFDLVEQCYCLPTGQCSSACGGNFGAPCNPDGSGLQCYETVGPSPTPPPTPPPTPAPVPPPVPPPVELPPEPNPQSTIEARTDAVRGNVSLVGQSAGPIGRSVTLLASAKAGYIFDRWEIVETPIQVSMTISIASQGLSQGKFVVTYTDPTTGGLTTISSNNTRIIKTIRLDPVLIIAQPNTINGWEWEKSEAYYPDGVNSSARQIVSPEWTRSADGYLNSEIRIFFRKP